MSGMKKKKSFWQSPEMEAWKELQEQKKDADREQEMSNEGKELDKLEKDLQELQKQVQIYYLEHPEKRSEYPDKIFVRSVEELEEKITLHIPKKVVEDEIIEKRVIEKTIKTGENPLDFSLMNEIELPQQLVNAVFQAKDKEIEEEVEYKRQGKSGHMEDNQSEGYGSGLLAGPKDYFQHITADEAGNKQLEESAGQEAAADISEENGEGFGKNDESDQSIKTIWKNKVFTGGGILEGEGFVQGEMFAAAETENMESQDTQKKEDELFQRLLRENAIDWSVLGGNDLNSESKDLSQPELPDNSNSLFPGAEASEFMNHGSETEESDSGDSFDFNYDISETGDSSDDNGGSDDSDADRNDQQGNDFYNNRVFNIKWEESSESSAYEDAFQSFTEYFSGYVKKTEEDQEGTSIKWKKPDKQAGDHLYTVAGDSRKDEKRNQQEKTDETLETPEMDLKTVEAQISDDGEQPVQGSPGSGSDKGNEVQQSQEAVLPVEVQQSEEAEQPVEAQNDKGSGENGFSFVPVQKGKMAEASETEDKSNTEESEKLTKREKRERRRLRVTERKNQEVRQQSSSEKTGGSEIPVNGNAAEGKEEEAKSENNLQPFGLSQDENKTVAGGFEGAGGAGKTEDITGKDGAEGLENSTAEGSKAVNTGENWQEMAPPNGMGTGKAGTGIKKSIQTGAGTLVTDSVKQEDAAVTKGIERTETKSSKTAGVGEKTEGITEGITAQSKEAGAVQSGTRASVTDSGKQMAGTVTEGTERTETKGSETADIGKKAEGTKAQSKEMGAVQSGTRGSVTDSAKQENKSVTGDTDKRGAKSSEDIGTEGNVQAIAEKTRGMENIPAAPGVSVTDSVKQVSGVVTGSTETTETKGSETAGVEEKAEGSTAQSKETRAIESEIRTSVTGSAKQENDSVTEGTEKTGINSSVDIGTEPNEQGAARNKRGMENIPAAPEGLVTVSEQQENETVTDGIERTETKGSETAGVGIKTQGATAQSKEMGAVQSGTRGSVADSAKQENKSVTGDTDRRRAKSSEDIGTETTKRGMENIPVAPEKLVTVSEQQENETVTNGIERTETKGSETACIGLKTQGATAQSKEMGAVQSEIRTSVTGSAKQVAGAVTESTGPYVQEAARNTKETLSGSKSTIQEEARDLILRSLQKQTGGAEDTKEEPKAKDIIKPEEADGKQKVDQDPEVDKRLKIEKAIEEKFYSKKTQSELNEELIRKREEERLAEELKTLLGLAEASDSSAKEIAAEKQQSTPIPAPTPVPVPKTVPIPKTIPIPKQVPVPNPISVPKTVPVPKPIPTPVLTPNSAKGIQSTLDSDTNTLTGESSAPILSSGAGSVLSTSLEDSPGAATAAAVTGAISEVVSEMSKVSDEAGKDTSDISSKKLSKKEKQRLGKLEQKKLKLNKETELPVAGEQIPQIDMENLEKGIHIDPEDRIKMAAAQVSEQSAANADKVTGKLLKQPDDSDQAGENNNAAKRLSKKEKKRLSKLEQQRIKQNQAEKEKIQVAGEAVPVAGEQIQIEEKAKSEKEETSLKNPPMELKEVIEKEKTPFWKVWLDKIRDLFLQSFKKEKFPALQGIEDLSNAAEASRVVVEHDDGFVNAIEGLIEGSVRGESIILEVHSVIKSDVVVTDYFYSKAKTVVFGNVYAKKVIVEGSIRGDIHASHSVEVKDGGCVFGNVQAPSISIDAKGYIAGNLNYEKGDMK